MIKKLIGIFFLILILPIAYSQAQQPQQGQRIDPAVYKAIQQEELKTRSELKAYMDEALKVNRDLIQEQVEYNKGVIYSDINKIIRNAILKLGIVTFVAVLTAMICYRFIILAIRKKFISKGLRNEYYG